MNALRKIIRDTFGFSGNEINGFLILLPLMLVAVCSEPVYRHWIALQERDWKKEHHFLDSLLVVVDQQSTLSDVSRPVQSLAPRFPHQPQMSLFDPNTASVTTMVDAGVPRHLATRIAAYREKGGRFKIKPDLLRIYGLDSALYRRLFAQIDLPSAAPTAQTVRKQPVAEQTPSTRFDLNVADTAVFKSIYGIGSRLAWRIVRFREALGGFAHANQLYEVYGLDSAVVGRLLEVSFVDEGFAPEKININTANEEHLASHPYIRKKIAKRITAYRFQHGLFTDVNELREGVLIRDDELERILPYITTGD